MKNEIDELGFCPNCRGDGWVFAPATIGTKLKCQRCLGSGYMRPYRGNHVIKNNVLGFMFDDTARRPRSFPQALLIRKGRPPLFPYILDGIGGEVREGETAQGAMRREFKEKTDLRVNTWRYVTTFSDNETFRVYVFSTIGDVEALRSMMDEPVCVFPYCSLPLEGMPNLEWLLPLCLAVERGLWSHDRAPSSVVP